MVTKYFAPALIGLACASLPAFGSNPILTKSNYSGFVPQEWARFEQCRVYTDRVEVENTYGNPEQDGFRTLRVVEVSITGGIQDTIAAAQQASLDETENYLCDAPSTVIKAHLEDEEIVLFQSGGCGSARLERQGAAAHHLRDVVDRYCTTTHDYGKVDTSGPTD